MEIYDSGASALMSPNRSCFVDFRSINPRPVKATDKTTFMATGIRQIHVEIPNGGSATKVRLNDILYCPDLAFTLISLSRCDTAGFAVMLKGGSCIINDKKGKRIGQIPLKNGLYRVDRSPTSALATYGSTRIFTVDEVHRKLGHIAHNVVRNLIESGTLNGIRIDWDSKPTFCEACAKAKPMHKPIPKERTAKTSRELGDKIHSDVWGPTTPTSYNSKSYYVSFTDYSTRWTSIECLSKKSEVLTKYKE
jgi:hypothetical protein